MNNIFCCVLFYFLNLKRSLKLYIPSKGIIVKIYRMFQPTGRNPMRLNGLVRKAAINFNSTKLH